jgi:type II secretory pathway pseudopilin PulG
MAFDSQMRPSVPRPGKARGDDGWVMLTLLLAMALLVIFAAAIVPSITFEIKRDREEEMIHRGVQYSRAIRAYYKKFGRYPTKIEDLENTSNLRFLRKRYKDPLNCKNSKCEDFKLLHFGDVQMTLSALGGASIPGATPVSGMSGGAGGSGGFSQPSTFGGNSGFGANSNSSFAQNQQTTSNSSTGPDTSQSASQASSGGTSDGTGATPTGTNLSGSGSGNPGSNQLGSGQIIGGPIVGVGSVSKDKTIREFNHKNKYKDWAFVYDPAMDRGGIIMTPYQPQLQGFGQQGTPNLNGQTGSGGNNGSSFGGGNGFGTSPSGMQNSPNAPSSGGFSTPNPPSNPPQQQ